jgi:hypothetical protein
MTLLRQKFHLFGSKSKAFSNLRRTEFFQKPSESLSQICSYISGKDLESIQIREVFNSDNDCPFATDYLNNSGFCTNPIDALYLVHKCVVSIRKATITVLTKGRTIQHSDINKMFLNYNKLFSS